MFQTVTNLITPRALFSLVHLPQARTKYEYDRMNRFKYMAIQNYAIRLTVVILDLVEPEIARFNPTTSKTLPQNQTRSGSDDPFQRYGRSKFSKMAASRHLGFGATGSRSIRSTVPENPALGSNTKSIGRSVAEIWPFEIFQDGGQPPSWIL